MARSLAKILSRRGYTVATAAHGQEALEQLAADRFHVVITDLNMPVMDGMQLLRRLQPDASSAATRRLIVPPTVVLTGHGSTQAAVEAMKLGAYDYLVKPCNPDELLMTIENVLRVGELVVPGRGGTPAGGGASACPAVTKSMGWGPCG